VETVTVVVSSVVPVFALIALGVFFGRRGKFDIRYFIDFVIYAAQPALIVSALSRHRIDLDAMLLTGLGDVFVVLLVGVLTLGYSRIGKDRGRDLLVCAMFANAANLPLPLAQFAFGAEGLSYQVVYMATNAVLLYTIGVAITSGGARGWLQVLRLPLIYATAIGVAISLTGVELPDFALRPVWMLGDTAIPLLLFTLGYRIGSAKLEKPSAVAPVVLLRTVGGAAAGLLFVTLFAPPVPVQRAVLLGCCMPTAVQVFMLCAKFGANPTRAASAVFTSTIFAMLYIPFLVGWLTTL